MRPLRCRQGEDRPEVKGKVIIGPWGARAQRDPAVAELVERYQGADEHDRLYLWLQHRDLRSVLDSSEQMFHNK